MFQLNQYATLFRFFSAYFTLYFKIDHKIGEEGRVYAKLFFLFVLNYVICLRSALIFFTADATAINKLRREVSYY